MAATSFKQIACYVTPEQHRLLQRLSTETLVPMQAILRQAVNDMLYKYRMLPKRFDDEYVETRILGLKKGVMK